MCYEDLLFLEQMRAKLQQPEPDISDDEMKRILTVLITAAIGT